MPDLPPPNHEKIHIERRVGGPEVPSEDEAIFHDRILVPTVVSVKAYGEGFTEDDGPRLLRGVSKEPSHWTLARSEDGCTEYLSMELPERGLLVLKRSIANSPQIAFPVTLSCAQDQDELARDFDLIRSGVIDLANEKWAMERIETESASKWQPIYPPNLEPDPEESVIRIFRGFFTCTDEGTITVTRIDRIRESDPSPDFNKDTLEQAEISIDRNGQDTTFTGETAEQAFEKVFRAFYAHEQVMEMAEGTLKHTTFCYWDKEESPIGKLTFTVLTTQVRGANEISAKVEFIRHSPSAELDSDDSNFEIRVTNTQSGEVQTASSPEITGLVKKRIADHEEYLNTPEGILIYPAKEAIKEAGRWDKLVPQISENGTVIEAFLLRTDYGPMICSQFVDKDGIEKHALIVIRDPDETWMSLPKEVEALLRKEVICDEASLLYRTMERALRNGPGEA